MFVRLGSHGSMCRCVLLLALFLPLFGCGGASTGTGDSGNGGNGNNGDGGGGDPPTASLTADPSTIQKGEASTLSWQTTNATTVNISGIGDVPASGAEAVRPSATQTYTLTATGTGGTAKADTTITVGNSPPPATIRHVVVLFQENRSTDNFFHGLPGADTANSGVNSQGEVIPLVSRPLVDTYNLGHSHGDFELMYDGGKMDGADRVFVTCTQNVKDCIPPNPQFVYVNPADVSLYFEMAENYAFADRMFQTNQGPSFPAHQFVFTATSAPTETSDLFAAENPSGAKGFGQTGCIAPSAETVLMIDPNGDESSSLYPCFEHTTLTDLLDAKNLSWRYYTEGLANIWTAPNAINHICQPDAPGGQCTGAEWNGSVIRGSAHVLTDIAQGQLANVVWVIPPAQSSDHPGQNDGSGPSWIASIVNAIGNSPYWADTAIFVTWDDWGGLYDHVAPPIINSYEYGFRVPLIIISPYVRPAYVSHVTHDFASIIKFTEKQFDLPTLGFADAVADDLSDCFDFTQAPLKFQQFNAPLKRDFFLHDPRPPGEVDEE